MHKTRILCAVLILAGYSHAARAAPITNIYNTGVTNAFVTIGAGNIADPHYRIISPTGYTDVTVIDTAFPFPPWLPNTYGFGGSRWRRSHRRQFVPRFLSSLDGQITSLYRKPVKLMSSISRKNILLPFFGKS